MQSPLLRNHSPAFRHDPTKSTLLVRSDLAVDWRAEPAVCGYRKLTAVSPRTGTEIPVPVSATPAPVSGVGVVVASDDGYVRMLDRQLQKVYWQRRLDRSIYASLVVDRDRRTVIVATTSGLVTCLTLRGELVWSQALPHPVFATPAVSVERSLLHVATFGSRCYGLALEDGAVAFEAAVPEPWHAAHGGLAAHRDVYASPVVTAASTVVLCAGEHVVCLACDGATVWSRDLGVGMKASPVAVGEGEAVVACAVDGSCTLLAASDGSVLRTTRLDGKIIASAAVSGQTIAVGLQDGRAYGLDASTLDVRWSAGHGAPRSYTSFSVLPNGDFVATAVDGDVVSLAHDDGSFRWQTSQVLGLPGHEPAMDITPVAAPDGRMYCASYGGDLYMFRFRPLGGAG
jgi:outer membrane protein assembly factor BamB